MEAPVQLPSLPSAKSGPVISRNHVLDANVTVNNMRSYIKY